MAIGSVDDAIAGCLPSYMWQKSVATFEAAFVWHSFAYSPGVPGAMVAPTPGLNGAAITSRDGLFPFVNPVGGDFTYLMRASCVANVTGTLLFCDRLWDNSSIASATTTLQAITSPTFPARDRNGSTNGDGVLLGMEVSTATTNGSPVSNTTITYTNSLGSTGKSATLSNVTPYVIPATAVAGTFIPFNLAAGDVGVRAVEGVTLGTSLGTGVVHLVAYRPVARIPVTIAATEEAVDIVTGGAVRLYDNSSLFAIWIPSTTTALGASGQLTFTQG